jgi:hypothetical protein
LKIKLERIVRDRDTTGFEERDDPHGGLLTMVSDKVVLHLASQDRVRRSSADRPCPDELPQPLPPSLMNVGDELHRELDALHDLLAAVLDETSRGSSAGDCPGSAG